ncbi:Putative serine/threonine-protein kinase-like protein CCR3 [Linum grandiflorum]
MAVDFTPFKFLILAAVFYSLVCTSSSTSLSFGSSSTIVVTRTNPPVVCGIVAKERNRYIKCFHHGQITSLLPTFSFESISAGYDLLCGLTSGGLKVFCWNILISDQGNVNFHRKRIYRSDQIALTDLTVGGSNQVCTRVVNSGIAKCWRGIQFPRPDPSWSFSTITAGTDFVCGIMKNEDRVYCWGRDPNIQALFTGLQMESLVASKTHGHVCGNTISGDLVCKGFNESGQLNVPVNSNFDFSGLAAGADFNCAIKKHSLTCWGTGVNRAGLNIIGSNEDRFDSVIASSDYICGLNNPNHTVSCWGIGWIGFDNKPIELPLGQVIPGPYAPPPRLSLR